MSDLHSVKGRIEGASGPVELSGPDLARYTTALFGKGVWTEQDAALVAAAFRGSVDAALALVERMLSGWAWSFCADHCNLDTHAWINVRAAVHPQDGTSSDGFDGFGATMPLAILSALITALLSKDTDHVE